MTAALLAEQLLNGAQLGVLLFLIAAGLTLVFGVMDFVNVAHGSLYMLGAYFAVTLVGRTGSFPLGVALAVAATVVVAVTVERLLLRHLYRRSHLEQVLGTFGLVMIANEAVRIVWGPAGLTLAPPHALAGQVSLPFGIEYPAYRLILLVAGVAVAVLLAGLGRTRAGMRIRAAATDATTLQALGVNVGALATGVFALGAALAGLAGGLAAPIVSVKVGMGESILILTFVVIVVGGVGSVRGAFLAALAVGLIDTLGRAYLPDVLRHVTNDAAASALGPAISAVLIYVAMAALLAARPQGLFTRGQ